MFAQQKVADEVGSDHDDPLGLMVITRPNTGKNPVEMPSKDLRYKYDILASSEEIVQHLRSMKNQEGLDEDERRDQDVFIPNA